VGSTPEIAQGNGLFSGKNLQLILTYALDLAARRTFVLHSSPRPTIFLEWSVIAAHVAVSQAEPVKHVFKKEGPEVLCGLYHHAKRVEPFSFCRKS
jgi:hypothetical protein